MRKENWCVARILFLLLILPLSEIVHGLKNWSPPGIEPGSMALNAIALTARPWRLHSGFGGPKFNYPADQPFNPTAQSFLFGAREL